MLDLKSLVPWGQKANVPVKHEDMRDPFTSFRREMDSVFDNFFNDFGRSGALRPSRSLGDWAQAMPSLDVEDQDKELKITAELPGVDEKDIDVTLSGDILTIRGEKKSDRDEKEGDRRYVERQFGSFSRGIRLPFEAGDQKIRASFDKGVLSIRIPKPDEVKTRARRIDVKAS